MRVDALPDFSLRIFSRQLVAREEAAASIPWHLRADRDWRLNNAFSKCSVWSHPSSVLCKGQIHFCAYIHKMLALFSALITCSLPTDHAELPAALVSLKTTSFCLAFRAPAHGTVIPGRAMGSLGAVSGARGHGAVLNIGSGSAQHIQAPGTAKLYGS